MELTYRGKSYESFTSDIEATLTGETATFLGKSYSIKTYNVAQRQQQKTDMTYRGVHYTR